MGIDFDEVERRHAADQQYHATQHAAEASQSSAATRSPLGRGPASSAVGCLLGVVILVVIVWLVVSLVNRPDDGPYAADLTAGLNAVSAEFESVTDEGGGTVAVETSLYPKDENKVFAENLCGAIAGVYVNGGADGLESARVRASDGSTLARCPLP